MSENIGFILGALFFLILIFGGALMEFLETRRKQKFAHEQEMAKIRASGSSVSRKRTQNERDD